MASLGDLFGSLFGWLLPDRPKVKASKIEEFTLPTADDGREYGRGYGTFWILGPNVTWYGDLLPRTQTKDGVKMIRYYMGLHIDWCEGPIDVFLELRADDTQGKLIWEGEVTSSQQITLDKDKLFGGREKGGGVAGLLDVMMGESTQVANDYLTGLLGSLPAFKGVFATVFRQGLVGANSPNVKPWVVKARRILEGWYDDDCWYAAKAPIARVASTLPGSSVAGQWYVPIGATYRNGATVYATVTVGYYGTAAEIGANAIAARNAATGGSYVCSGTLYQTVSGEINIVGWDVIYGPGVGIAACLGVLAECGAGYTAEIIENAPDSSAGIDNPSVMCNLDSVTIYDYDMNPAHILYDLHTHPFSGMGWPSAQMDDTQYRDAADVFFTEGFGLSFPPAGASRCRERIREIEEHTDSVCRLSSTGKFQVVPIRADYDPDMLITWTDANIKTIEDNESVGYGELTGRVAVAYTDYLTGKTATTAFVTNPTTIRAQAGIANPVVISYPGIRNPALAARVRDRELRKRSQPLKAFTVLLDRSDVVVERGDVRKISSTRYGYSDVIVRVVAVNRGRLQDRMMRVRVIEDVFGLSTSSYTTPVESTWVEPETTPVAITIQDALEIPYHWMRAALGDAEAATVGDTEGFGRPLAVTPQALATGYDLWGRISPADYVSVADDLEFFDTATLSAAVARDDTTLNITGANIDEDIVAPGHLIVVGDATTGEWMRITGGDLSATITVDRAILDTTPQEHAIGARVWVMHPEFNIFDETRYIDADVVDYKLLTQTSGGVLAIGDATAVSVTMDSRQIRPYPPAGMTINGEGYPTSLYGSLSVAYVNRNRVTQYPDIYGQSEATVTPEAGTTINGYAYDDDTDAVLVSTAGIGNPWAPVIVGSRNLRIEIESERGGIVSWQRQVRVFTYTSTAPLLDEDDLEILDEDDIPITGE